MMSKESVLGNNSTSWFGWMKKVLGGLFYKIDALESRLANLEELASVAARRVSVSCGEHGVLVKSSVGYVLCPANDFQMIACLVDTGDMERGTRLLVERIVRPGDVVADVGANIGMFSLAAARVMNGTGHIHAFEPLPATARTASVNFDMNGFGALITLTQAAIADEKGEASLYLGRCSGHHSLFPLSTDGVEVTVPVLTLDQALADVPHVDLLKIDVEGAELKVLNGARNIIERSPDGTIIVEFGPSHLARVGCTPQNWFDQIRAFGLDAHVINDYSGELERWPIERLVAVDSANLLLARPSSRMLARLINS